MYLEQIIPTLEKLSEDFDFNLSIMGSYAPKSEKLAIKHYIWDDKKFSDIIKNSHIGLYPNLQKDKTKNYTVAGKVLDYLNYKVPIIGANQGLPEGIDPEKCMIIADKLEDWEEKLKFAF